MALFWSSLIIFVAVMFTGNYLLSKKVLPGIDANSEISSSGHVGPVEDYLRALPDSDRNGFAFLFLKYYQKIQAATGLLLLANILYFSIF